MQTPVLKGVGGGWWRVEKASTESESQMTEGCAQNADAVLEWNIKALASLSGGIKKRGSHSKKVQCINKCLKQKLGEY